MIQSSILYNALTQAHDELRCEYFYRAWSYFYTEN